MWLRQIYYTNTIECSGSSECFFDIIKSIGYSFTDVDIQSAWNMDKHTGKINTNIDCNNHVGVGRIVNMNEIKYMHSIERKLINIGGDKKIKKRRNVKCGTYSLFVCNNVLDITYTTTIDHHATYKVTFKCIPIAWKEDVNQSVVTEKSLNADHKIQIKI